MMGMSGKNTKGRKRTAAMLLWIAFAAAALFGLKPLNDNIPSAQTKSSGVAVQKLMPVGAAVGIHIQTNGLMVLGTAQITDSDGRTVIPAKDAVREGDYILAVDGRTVNTAGEMTEAIRQKGGSAMCLRVLRNGEVFEVEVSAVKTTDGSYKTGIWVRDDTQGIGTLSFIDEDNRFAALGHGIADVDTGKLIDMSVGGLYPSSIYSIVKGKSLEPGEMVGNILYGGRQKFASVLLNTDSGIFGRLDSGQSLYKYDESKALPSGTKETMHVGDAGVMCQIYGEISVYDAQITGIDYNGGNSNKDFILEITDPALLECTGGIIQGMSGSPVIQDGKLVGVVTHVFLNDSTKGYGIFIENMLSKLDTIGHEVS